jgi:hypothetical protein
MKSIFNLSALFFLLLLIPSTHAQIAIGEWRDHLPYSRTVRVAEVENMIYCATQYSIFVYDKDDQSVLRKSKVNGLSDVGISAMMYNKEYKTLVITYTNTNIDLIKEGKVINFSDIKRRQILGNKTINNITFNDSLTYFSCGFGIVVLDIKNEEFPEPTYFIGPEGSQLNVLDITFGADSVYAATESGIYKASLNSTNLANFNEWTKDQRLYPDKSFNAITFYNGRLFTNSHIEGNTSDTLFMYDYYSHTWSILPGSSFLQKFRLNVSNEQLIEVTELGIQIYDQSFSKVATFDNPGGINLQSRDVIIDKNNTKWIADNRYGLVSVENDKRAFFITPNGPHSHKVFDMAIEDQKLWVASGGRTLSWGKMYIADGVYSFINESWKNYNGSTGYKTFDTINDMTCIAINPKDNRQVFVGNWVSGVIEFFDEQVVNVYSTHNSSLQIWPTATYVAVSGMDFDSHNNLWVVNSGATNLLSAKKPDGTWKGFYLGSNASSIDASKVMVDSYNQKWILVRADHKLVVFSENNTFDNTSDDKVKILTNAPGNGNLPGNKIYSIAEDQDGRIWIGTDQGVGVIYSPQNVFGDGNYDVQRILVEVGGYVQYLLESEVVTSIAIDGDNQKWIGTERAGVFLLSANGTEQIHHFTEENSPLFSNLIVDIAINHKSGEIFFATSRGIISYRGTATNPNPTHSDVVVFPNPVRESYTGAIAINGLVNKANVKITDINGNLVYTTKVEGGQVIWYGTNMSGKRASSGVYLVFVSDDQGVEKMVTKILFIK